MADATRVLDEALKNLKVIDPHCHLRMAKPSADNLADILLYHHLWTELVSSGMGQYEVCLSGLPQEVKGPEMDPKERVRRAVRHLGNIESTTTGLFLRWIMKDLFGVETLAEDNWKEAWRKVEEKANDPSWSDEVLKHRSGIEYSISVEDQGTPCSGRLLKARQVYATNLTGGTHTAAEILADWDRSLGREIASASDYRDLLSALLAPLIGGEHRFIGLRVVPHISSEPVDEERITRILRAAREGQSLSEEQTGAFCFFAVGALLELLRKTPLRLVQLVVGAEVFPPHRGVTRWHPGFPLAMARIAGGNEDFRFELSTASDAYTQDLGALARHFPNISVAGYWWHTLFPTYIRKSIEIRLDMVPLNKITAFFSDSYHAEWCYPKLKLVKQTVRQVLLERIERGWYTLDLALEILQKIFHDNPKRIYGIQEG